MTNKENSTKIRQKGLINTSWDDYYLNPLLYNKNENKIEEFDNDSEQNIITSSVPLANIVNNLTNKTIPNPSKGDKNKTELTTSFILTNNFEENNKTFNPILFKLIANDNISQLELSLKSNKSHNINQQDKDGDTPLHISVFLSNIEAIKILIKYGANIYLLDKWGQTPLHRICFTIGEHKSLEILDIFIKTNKDSKKNIFNIQDNYGNTSCHLVLKHIIKNKTILNSNIKTLIKKICQKTSKKLKNNDNLTINDLLKNITV